VTAATEEAKEQAGSAKFTSNMKKTSKTSICLLTEQQGYDSKLIHMGLFDSNLIIISMQNRDLVASTIALENDILLLATRWQQLSQQVTDRKDLMRKLREQEIKISQSTYCIVSGVSVKKNPQEVYPAL
jgi:hypothetical protein